MKILISIGSLGLGGAEKQAIWLANQFANDNDVTLITFYGGTRESELSKNIKWIRLIPELDSEQSDILHYSENSKFIEMSGETSTSEKSKIRRKSYLRAARNGMCLWIKTNVEKSKIASRVINKILWGILLIRSFRKVHKLITNFQPKYVITFLYHDTLILGLATLLRMAPPKLVVGRRSPFGYCEENRSLLQKLLMRWIYSKSNAAVTNSISNIPNAIMDGIASEKLHLVENFVDSDANRFSKAKEKQLSLLCIANFYDYKNHFNLIKAISSFPGSVKVTFLGEGPLKAAAIELADDLGIDSKFYSHEDQRNVIAHQMDFFVLPSKFEGSSNALLEALIEGFPAITTPVGNASQLSKIGAPIILTSGFEIQDFEVAIQRALQDKDHYSSVARTFMDRIANIHSKETIFADWLNLLDKLSESPKGK